MHPYPLSKVHQGNAAVILFRINALEPARGDQTLLTGRRAGQRSDSSWESAGDAPLAARPSRRILAVEKRELPIQLGPVAREHRGFGEEGLAHDGEELGWVLGRVVVYEGRPAGVDFAAEALVGFFERLAPLRGVHSGTRGGKVALAPSVHVDLVRELVDDHVVAALGEAHVFPGEDHRPARPRFPGELLVEGVDDAVLVHLLLAHAEFSGIDDDADPAVIYVQAEVENRQAGLRGDRQARFVGELEAVRTVHFLFREEQDDELLEPRRFLLRQAAEERELRCDPRPQRLVDARAFQHALAAPLAQETHASAWR